MKQVFIIITLISILLTSCTPAKPISTATSTSPATTPTSKQRTILPFTPTLVPTLTPSPTVTGSPTPIPLPPVISDTNVQNLKLTKELGKGMYPIPWDSSSAVWSPDGKKIAISGSAKVYLIDAESMKEESLNIGPAISVVFSPDGKYLATNYGDIWDVENHTIKNRLAVKDDWGGNFVAFSSDSKSVLINSDSQRLLRVNINDGKTIQTITLESKISSGAINKDGTIIALVDGDQKIIRLYDAKKGARLSGSEYIHYQEKIRQVVFSPDGNKIAVTGLYDDSVKLWDSHKGTFIKNLEGDFESMFGVSFSPNGKVILASSYSEPLRFLDAESGKIIQKIDRTEDFVSYSPDGSKIALSNLRDKSVSILNVDSEKIIGKIEDFFGIDGFNFSNDSSSIFSGCGTGKYCIWNYENGTYGYHDTENFGSLWAVSTKGIAAIAFQDGVYYVHFDDLNTQKTLCYTVRPYEPDALVSPNGQFGILSMYYDTSSGYGNHRVLWDINNCQIVKYLRDFVGNFTYDGNLAEISKTGRLNIYDIKSNDLISSVQLEKFDKHTSEIAINPETSLIVGTTNSENILSFWRIKDGKLIFTITLQDHSRGTFPIFSPDGRSFAINLDGRIAIFNVEN